MREVCDAVYTVPTSASTRLAQLVEAGTVVSEGPEPRYRYRPASDEIASRVDAVAEAYARDRVAVIKAVLERATDPARQFADAFRLRGDKT